MANQKSKSKKVERHFLISGGVYNGFEYFNEAELIEAIHDENIDPKDIIYEVFLDKSFTILEKPTNIASYLKAVTK